MTDVRANRWSSTRLVVTGFFFVIVLVAGFGAWAVTTEIAGAVVASGRIEVDRNRQVVQHETGGVVSEIFVTEGDEVEAGDVLIRLDPEQLASQLSVFEGRLFEMAALRGRLEAETDARDQITFDEALNAAAEHRPDLQELMRGQENLFNARRDSVRQQIEQLGQRKSQILAKAKGVEAQEAALNRQLAIVEEELDGQRSLFDRGLARNTIVLNLQREEAQIGGQIGELLASKAEALERINEIEIEILKLGTTTREEAIASLRDLRSDEVELTEKHRALQVEIDRLNIHAPVSGIVYGLEVHTPRAVLRAAEPLMYLVPQDRPLVIVVRVMPTNIDQVNVGQQVNLRMSALDSRTTPELVGQVTQISADAINDAATNLTYYRAAIMLSPGEMETLPDDVTLLPGMPVEAFIRTGDRSPMSYLTKPLTDYFAHAFREN